MGIANFTEWDFVANRWYLLYAVDQDGMLASDFCTEKKNETRFPLWSICLHWRYPA